MQKLEDEVRADIRDMYMYMSRNHSTAKGVIITNQLRHVAPVIRHYVKYLEDNFRLTQADEGAELVKFSCLKEMAEYLYAKPLTRWQMNQLERWEESREKVCPRATLVIDPMKEAPEDGVEVEVLRAQVVALKERLVERDSAYSRRLKELTEAQRKLRQIHMVANISADEEEKDEEF